MSLQASHGSRGQTTGTALTAEHERLIRHLFERVYSTGELDLIDDLVASTYVGYGGDPDGVALGADGARAHVVRLRSAFFGLTLEVDEIDGDAEGFEVHWTARGRLERPIGGLAPATKRGPPGTEPGGPWRTVTGATTGRIVDGEIRELHRPPGAA